MSLSVNLMAKIIHVESKCVTFKNALKIARLIQDAEQDLEIKDFIESPTYLDKLDSGDKWHD
jgi:hypothetical protein